MMTGFLVFFFIIVIIISATGLEHETTAITTAVDSACEIQTCSPNGGGCRQCTESRFSCSNRHLTGICKNFYNDGSANMINVDVAHNDIANFSSFPITSNITELSISFNKFTIISRVDLARFPMLRKLHIAGNKLVNRTFAEDTFEEVPFLEELWLAKMELTDLLENIFKNNKHLVIIDFGWNKFTKIPKNVFKSGNNLKTLIFDHNPIEKLEKSDFEQLRNVHKLHLENTNIRLISASTFSSMISLLEIDLDHNTHLESIDDDAFGFFTKVPGHFTSKLKSAMIRGCNLHSLNEHTMNYLELEEFGVSGNPWTCACELKWMLDLEYWKRSSRLDVILAEFNKTRCSNEPFKDMTLSAMANNHKLVCFNSQLTARFSGIGGITTLLLVTLLVCAISLVLGVLTYRRFTNRVKPAPAVNQYKAFYNHGHVQTDEEETDKEKTPFEL